MKFHVSVILLILNLNFYNIYCNTWYGIKINKEEDVSTISENDWIKDVDESLDLIIYNESFSWEIKEKQLDSLIILASGRYGITSMAYAFTIHKKGVLYHWRGILSDFSYYNKAIQYYQNALSVYLQIQREKGIDVNKELINEYSMIGACNSIIGNDYQAIDYLLKGLNKLEEKNLKEELYEDYFNLNIQLAKTYKSIGNFDQTLKHQNSLIAFLNEINPWETKIIQLKIIALTEKGGLLANYLFNPDDALLTLQTCEEILSSNQISNVPKYLASIYTNKAISYYRDKHYNKAILEGKKAVEQCLLAGKREKLADNYMNLGVFYNQAYRLDSSTLYLRLAKKLYSELGLGKKLQGIYDNLSDLEFKKGNYHKSIEYDSLAISLLGTSSFSNLYKQNQILSKKEYLTSFSSVAFSFLTIFKNQRNVINLNKAYDNFLLSDYLIGLMRQEFQAEASRMSLASYTKPIYEKAIETCYELYQLNHEDSLLEKAFEYSEKSRAIVLLDAVRKTKASTHVPDTLIAQEKAFNLKANYFEKQAAIYEQDKEKKQAYNVYDSILFYRRKRQSIVDQIKESTPEYHQLIFEQATATLDNVRQSLKDNQAFIEYFMGDSSIFTFYIDKEKTLFLKNDNPGEIVNQISQWSASITNQEQSFMKPSYQLYHQLIAPVSAKTILPLKLMIVPDEALNQLNFEVLITKDPGNERIYLPTFKDYLLYQHQIGYTFSATSLLENKHHKGSENFLGIAPEINEGFKFEDNWFDKLNYNTEEVQQIGSLFSKNKIIQSDNAMAAFFQQAPNYRLIHCATHALANDQDGDLSFVILGNDENNVLYAKDLYALNLNADLVVLSACQTNAGEINRGEGIISLARGFAYAGASSIVTSLWNVREKTNKEIVYHFYQYLKDGKTKDEALRLSKLDYLAGLSREEQIQAHPYFWAPLIILGDTNPIKSNQSNWMALSIIAILAILLGLYTYKKRM